MVIHLLTLLLAQSMFTGSPIDGIRCEAMEGAVMHIHSRLTVSDHGRPITIPANIGIPQGAGCLYWLHTHSDDGLLHIEAPVKRNYTLGQFFDVWGQPLSRGQAASVRARRGSVLRVSVNGKAWKGDPRSIPLRDNEEIRISNS